MASQCRQNYHEETEALVNKLINLELNAHHQYVSLMAQYSRDDVALRGSGKLFKKLAKHQMGYCKKLIRYQHLRGGHCVMGDINQPADQQGQPTEAPMNAFKEAIDTKKAIVESMLEMHKSASNGNDPQTTYYLRGCGMKKRVKAMNKLAKYHTNLERIGDGRGVYMFDKKFRF